MVTFNKHEVGKKAEEEAKHFLQTKGLYILLNNYHCCHGEIDLIMQDKDDIVFIEVRKRTTIDYGNAFETVNFSKRKKLIKTAIHFLQRRKWLYKVNSRFDVIAIHPHSQSGLTQIEWIQNAFSIENDDY